MIKLTEEQRLDAIYSYPVKCSLKGHRVTRVQHSFDKITYFLHKGRKVVDMVVLPVGAALPW